MTRNQVWWIAGTCLTLAAPVEGQGPNIRVQVPGIPGVVLLDSIAERKRVIGNTEAILKAIDSAYAFFQLPVEAIDPAVGRLPNRRVTLSRRMGKTPLSRFLDCGRGFSGNYADMYRVTISTAAWLSPPRGDTTEVNIAIIGGALDPAGTGDGYVLCTSRGYFEADFARKVTEIVSRR
ncbi:MAG: hypothetical protein IT361_07670 [Gemmatimonadaceae bacterium]|nr:hypothetical protein [Gemmatimonadaceae bacterium]